QLKDKLPTMSEEYQLKLLATDGMLVKRPLMISNDFILVGFKDKFCVFAILILTLSKSFKYSLQQHSLPQIPIAPIIFAWSRIPICLSSILCFR
ncbi:MAG: hypothetical protein J6V40_06215, partial [Clostridia bacterium]|nr:hypothetical protein [Clostridia bacterium]